MPPAAVSMSVRKGNHPMGGGGGGRTLGSKNAVEEFIFGSNRLVEPCQHVAYIAERIMRMHFDWPRGAPGAAYRQGSVKSPERHL